MPSRPDAGPGDGDPRRQKRPGTRIRFVQAHQHGLGREGGENRRRAVPVVGQRSDPLRSHGPSDHTGQGGSDDLRLDRFVLPGDLGAQVRQKLDGQGLAVDADIGALDQIMPRDQFGIDHDFERRALEDSGAAGHPDAGISNGRSNGHVLGDFVGDTSKPQNHEDLSVGLLPLRQR